VKPKYLRGGDSKLLTLKQVDNHISYWISSLYTKFLLLKNENNVVQCS